MTRTITDTADRIREADLLRVDSAWMLVLGIADARTPAHPARLAVVVCDPHGPLADLGDSRTVHLHAGEIVTFRGDFFLADSAGRRPGGV